MSIPMSDRDEVLICPHCGAIRSACDLIMAQQDKEWQKDKRKMMAKGYLFDVVKSEEVRLNFGSHKAECPFKSQKQPSLF